MNHWRVDNTEGYTQAELDALNQELASLLVGVEPHTDDWYAIISRHADDVARR